MKTIRRSLFAVMAIVAAAFGVPQKAAAQQYSGKSGEQILFEAANRERAQQGLKPLRWDQGLAASAKAHAALLARDNTLSHQLPGEAGLPQRASRAGVKFTTLAENVAEGPSAEQIHVQWMRSAPHRANLLDPQLDSIGIAVAVRGTLLFAVEDFSVGAQVLTVQVLTVEEQERLLAAKLRALGLRILDYSEDARHTCQMNDGYAGQHEPSFVVHYVTSDVQEVPDLLRSRIQTSKYHSAAVGACAPGEKETGTQYRLAVMLFE